MGGKNKSGIDNTADLISEARLKCIEADVLVSVLVEETAAITDERISALIYLVEASVKAARVAVERASKAKR